MKYVKAQNVLPKEVIELIQEYIDGEFLYIPRKDGKQKAWGEKSGAKESLQIRNEQIYRNYLNGAAIDELCGAYYLSEQSIRRIICREKARFSNSVHNCL